MNPQRYTLFVIYRNRYREDRGEIPCDVHAELCSHMQDTTDLERLTQHWREVHNDGWEPLHVLKLDLRDKQDLLLATHMAIDGEAPETMLGRLTALFQAFLRKGYELGFRDGHCTDDDGHVPTPPEGYSGVPYPVQLT